MRRAVPTVISAAVASVLQHADRDLTFTHAPAQATHHVGPPGEPEGEDGGSSKAATGRPDWAVLRAMSEDAIERIAAEDEDNPGSDEDHWAQATVGLPPGKTSIHASFDRDVVAFFKRDGRGYRTRMTAVLRRYMEAQQGKKA